MRVDGAEANDRAALARRGAAGRTTPAYLIQDGDEWRPLSWAEAAERVESYANGLLSLGVRKGDAFAILGSSRVEWALFDFALGSVGAIGAAIYANSSPQGRRLHPRALRVGRRALRGRDPAREGRVRARRDAAAAPRAHLRRPRRPAPPAGAPTRPSTRTRSARRGERIEESDLFTYIYTSGTTGPPKGCMISHLNYYAMVAVVDDLPSFTGPGDTMLLYLPLAHNFGRLMHLSGAYVGYAIAFLPDPLQAAAALPAVKPTVFPSVPRVYEKIHTAVVAKFDAETGVKRKLIDWALGVGRRVSALRRAGRAGPARPRAAAPDRRPARLREGQGAPRRPAAAGDLRRRAALGRDRRVLPRDRHPPGRGLRPDRVHDRRVDEHARGASASARSAARCRAPS